MPPRDIFEIENLPSQGEEAGPVPRKFVTAEHPLKAARKLPGHDAIRHDKIVHAPRAPNDHIPHGHDFSRVAKRVHERFPRLHSKDGR